MRFSLKKRYFEGPLSGGFASLYIGRSITTVAGGLLGLFLPLFLYNLFHENIGLVLLYFSASHFLYLIFVIFGAQFLNRFGFRNALRASVLAGALHFGIFIFVTENTAWFLIPLTVLILLIYRLLYWIPYHVDLAKFTSIQNRGRELSLMEATFLIISTLVPVIAGFIIVRYDFSVLFFLAIVLYLVSGFSYITIPETNERFSWGYMETWKKFFSHLHSKTLLGYMADGAESVVGLIIWPVFIFQILDGDYLSVGVLSTLITAVAIVVQLSLGRIIDTTLKKETVMWWGSIFYSLGWIAKTFIATAFGIFVAGAYHSIMHIFTRTPLDTLTYEMAADEGHYVDEFTVLKEIALTAGKLIMFAATGIALMFVSIQWTFLLSALAALALTLLGARDLHIGAGQGLKSLDTSSRAPF